MKTKVYMNSVSVTYIGAVHFMIRLLHNLLTGIENC